MGEKEQGAARESSAPSVSERDAQSGKAAGITGDPDFDLARASTVKGSKSNSSERLASGDLSPAASGDDDAGDGTLDEGPLSVLKSKTKSNQSNDRLAFDDDPGGSGAVAGGEPLEASNLNLSKSNINRTTIGDPDFDLAAQKKMPEHDKDVSR